MTPPQKAPKTSSKLDKFRRQGWEQAGEDGSPSFSDTDQSAADTTKVLEAISSCQAILTTKIDAVNVDISLIIQNF